MKRYILSALALVAFSGSAHAAWTLGQWVLSPDNGHYYSVQQITGPTTGWLIARAQAKALIAPNGSPVDLVTITSPAEDDFVFAGINSPAYWKIDPAANNEGPNIGAFQADKLAEPDGHWAWVTGEPFVYNQWSSGSPNNTSNLEDYATLFSFFDGRSGSWNDISSATSNAGDSGSISFYVAEATSVPEPATISILALSLAGFIARRRRSPK